MKVKQLIGQVVNGFKILDTYVKTTENGKKTRKVLVECQNCGAIIERSSGVDFEHLKCKCKCVSYSPNYKTDNHVTKYQHNGKEYRLFELVNLFGTPRDKIYYMLKKGYPIEIAIKGKVKRECVICGKEFETSNLRAVCCSHKCQKRRSGGKGKWNPEYTELKDFVCEVCGNEFQSYHPKARFCSDKCRRSAARLERRQKFRELKKIGKFDISVTLETVYDKFGGKCCSCNKPLHFGENPIADDYPTIDHIKPLSKGGSHEWDNVQLMCRFCNNSKGAKYEERTDKSRTIKGDCNRFENSATN